MRFFAYIDEMRKKGGPFKQGEGYEKRISETNRWSGL